MTTARLIVTLNAVIGAVPRSGDQVRETGVASAGPVPSFLAETLRLVNHSRETGRRSASQ